ncbi:hypothetical protein IGJ28_001096 [Enterococcus sp. AZ091]
MADWCEYLYLLVFRPLKPKKIPTNMIFNMEYSYRSAKQKRKGHEKKMNKEVNGCVVFEKQGNDLSVSAGNLSASDALTLTLFSIVSLAKASGISLARIHQALDQIDQHLELEECEKKNE